MNIRAYSIKNITPYNTETLFPFRQRRYKIESLFCNITTYNILYSRTQLKNTFIFTRTPSLNPSTHTNPSQNSSSKLALHGKFGSPYYRYKVKSTICWYNLQTDCTESKLHSGLFTQVEQLQGLQTVQRRTRFISIRCAGLTYQKNA